MVIQSNMGNESNIITRLSVVRSHKIYLLYFGYTPVSPECLFFLMKDRVYSPKNPNVCVFSVYRKQSMGLYTGSHDHPGGVLNNKL
jgi:hypothetical protein